MSYRAIALDVLPEIQSFAVTVLSTEKLQEADLVARKLIGSRKERQWASTKTISEVGIEPSRPLMYWATEIRGLPRNTRNCIRYLGDYMDLLVKEMTFELLGGKARRRSLGSNARLLAEKVPEARDLAEKISRYAGFIYTPGKHDFSLPAGRKHSFTAKEVVLSAYITAELAKGVLSISKCARYAVEKDNLYSIGGRWGSANRVKYHGESEGTRPKKLGEG